MPRKVHEILKLIQDDGWVLKRVRGSHRQFAHPSKPGVVTVAGKPSKDLPRGLERSILRQAGLLRVVGNDQATADRPAGDSTEGR
jgi:predicted RNA binding protein YcfA (HicA-like mRNA interferase family)